jgi:hypothetical protein
MRTRNWILKVRKVFPPEQAEVLEEMVDLLDELVKVGDFNELKAIVADLARAQKELAEAQKRTEQRLEELAEAQKKTEQRLEELAEAQKRTEQRLEELAEAQKRTEQRLEELAEAQKRTEQRLEELAEAQKETEKELRTLAREHQETRKQIGGLSHTASYLLEDRSYRGLPELLKKEYGIEITEPLKRDRFKLNGKRIEVNIIGKGIKEGKEIWIVGEAKSQLKKKDVDAFLRRRQDFERLFPGEKLYVLVTYMDVGEAAEYARKKDIKVYYSYQFPV